MKKFIYHSKDLDGIFCGVIASMAFSDPILIGYDYGDEVPMGGDGNYQTFCGT